MFIGGAFGYYGALEAYYGYEWAISKAGQWNTFSRCMRNCGRECGERERCKNRELFEQSYVGVRLNTESSRAASEANQLPDDRSARRSASARACHVAIY